MFISLALNLPAFQTKLVVPEHISVQKNDNIEQLYIHCFSASSPLDMAIEDLIKCFSALFVIKQ